MAETIASFELHSPAPFKQLLEKIHLREIRPADICPPNELERLYQTYPDLLGDRSTFDDRLDPGHCPSWKDNPGWWKNFLKEITSKP